MLADLLSEGATPVAASRFQRGRPQVSPVTLAFCAKSVHSWPPTGRPRFFLACAIIFLVVEEVCAAESVVMISWFYLRRDISTSKVWSDSLRWARWALLKVPKTFTSCPETWHIVEDILEDGFDTKMLVPYE